MIKILKQKWIIGASTVMLSLLFLGCSEINTPVPKHEKLVLPAITETETNKHYSGKFVWHDLLTDDVTKAKPFYAGLFGWSYKDKHGYTTIYHHGKSIGGMMHIADSSDKKREALWLPSLSVENVDRAADTVKANKGTVLKGPLNMSQRGRGVLASDAQGAHIVLLHAKGGDPLDSTVNMGDWLWNELWTSKPKESEDLYRRLGKYDTVTKVEEYRILKNKGKWRGGIRDVSEEDSTSHWVPVVRVADLQKSMDKVIHLGGQVLMKPRKEIADGKVAVIADNTGALLMIQRWSDKGGK